MGRPKKLRIRLNQDSLTELLQESYSQLAEQRNISLRQYNNQLLLLNKKPDALLSKTNADLLKIIDSSIEKKISIARLIKDIVYSDGNAGGTNKNGELSIEDRKAIFDAVNKEGSNVLKDKIEEKNLDIDYGDLSKSDDDDSDIDSTDNGI